MAKNASKGDYEVGYGKPPRNTQWKKGQSGNRSGVGRPLTLLESAAIIAQQTITVTVNGKRRRVTKQDAMLMATTQNAMNGKQASARLVFDLLAQAPPVEIALTREEEDTDFQEATKGYTMEDLELLSDFATKFAIIKERRRKK